MAMILYFLLITFSKTGFLTLAGCIGFLFFLIYKKTYIKYIFNIILMITITFFIFQDQLTVITDRFVLYSDNYSTQTTGRVDLQEQGLSKWYSGDFMILTFGEGINDAKEQSNQLSTSVLHSVYVQTMVEQGIIGFFILLFFIISLARKVIKPLSFYTLPFIVFFITSFALSGLFYWDIVLYYILYDIKFLNNSV